jgi:uncharacterized membrane protein YhdT
MVPSRYKVLATLPLLAGTAARAAAFDCTAGDTSLNCRLTGVLHWLEAAAFLLGLILIAVIAVAVHLFRKNRLSRKEGR